MKKYLSLVLAIIVVFSCFGVLATESFAATKVATVKLSSVSNTSTGVAVKWSKASGAAGYYVYRKAGSAAWSKIATIKSAKTVSYTDKTAKSGTTYTYTVGGYNGKTKGAYNKTGLKTVFLSMPKLTVKQSSKNIVIKWAKITGAKSYTIYKQVGKGSWAALKSGVTSLTYTDKSLKEGTKYSYKIVAINGKYKSATSSVVSLTLAKVWDKTACFNFYKKACDNIKKNGSQGFTRKEWQELKSLDLGAASSVLTSVVKSFITSESEAGEKVCAKGSSDAKNAICPCACSISYVQSATKQDLANGHYKIKIVMKNENSPKKGSAGIASMSTGILYMEDVANDVEDISVIKSFDKGSILYKSYTIEAEMTKDGKFVDINHYVSGELSATVSVKLIGKVSGGGVLDFHSHWYKFK